MISPTPHRAALLKTLLAMLVALQIAGESFLLAAPEGAAESTNPPASVSPSQHSAPTAAERDEEFQKLVTDVTLIGTFTLDGAEEAEFHREEYVIRGAVKLGANDLWVLTSRIKYGNVDLTVPVPVQVKWAGSTPVITVDRVAIPGLGTFSARVLLDKARYAGTWSHDEKGGHMFGVIERNETAME